MFAFTQPTQWSVLPANDAAEPVYFSGRLIGGCLDTVGLLSATEYLNLPQMKAQYAQDGLILFLENAELSPTAMARMLMTMKFNGVFDAVNGVIFGRDGSPLSHGKSLSHAQVIQQVLGDLAVPVILDADIGHLAPNLPLMNGAVANVQMSDGKAWIQQTLS
ncbi:hypothetical protein [Photobacterium sp. Hal280]|uniref:hypothetical protein n=1 Tax=Photobacterium sp. Hal280 TaxID=3035163 RepID=UPI00301D3A49